MRGSWAGLLIVACSATQGAPPAVTPAATAAAATPTPAAATLVPSSDPALAVVATAAASTLTAADFARSPDYETARISPDGRYLAVTKYQDGMRALVVLERTTLAISHIENFNPPNEVADFIWVKDHRLLISLATHVGALDAPVLTGEIWGVDADGARGRMVYDWRSTRAAATATGPAHLLDTLPRDPTHVVIVTDTGGQLGARKTVAQLLDVYSGHLQPLTTAPLRDARLLTDRDGVVRLAMARNASFELEIHYRDSATTPWRRLLSLPFGVPTK